MKKYITLSLLLIAFCSFGQVVNIPKAGNWQFVDGTIPPDTTDCQCQDGAQGPKGDTGPQGPQGIQGIQGPPGPPGSGSGGSVPVYGIVDVTQGPWNIKGDGLQDDGPGFTGVINSWRGVRGALLVIPPPKNFYSIRTTIQAVPDGSNQLWMNIAYLGGPGSMKWQGSDNSIIWKIVGLKGSEWSGFKISADGKTGITFFDIDTTPSAQSTSFNFMRGFYLNLGSRANNVAFRLGHVSGGSADISDYHFEHNTILGNEGGTPQPGQIAYLVEGANTLACEVVGGFVAWCQNVFSNKSGAGATSSRGNSGVAYFTNVQTSQNIIDYSFNFEGTYVISGIRAESSSQVFETGTGVGIPAITFIGCRFNDYKGNQIGTLNSAATVTFDNCHFHKQGSPFPQMFVINSNGNSGTIMIRNGSTHYNTLYTKQGTTVWKLYMEGMTRWSGPAANFTTTVHIPDINGFIIP